ncbi:hypothetical protein BN1723_014287 [Verticillium longisporum]|uniref:Uncharacterized protein n=1 Tax=Verticillium longisporum TaxID=100787 RepID=A0A0G4M6H5_VERLO|nr:hypothetical protein BN1723_014287 [Verticillium longisporum]
MKMNGLRTLSAVALMAAFIPVVVAGIFLPLMPALDLHKDPAGEDGDRTTGPAA